jgi:hypothetical protein
MNLLFGWRGRVRWWPRVNAGGPLWCPGDIPGDVKVISTAVLERLMDKAVRTPWASAVGRPEWLESHRSELRDHYVVVLNWEGHGLYRCLVVSVVRDGPGGAYTLDVKKGDFHALRDIAPARLIEFARRHLESVPMLPLDPSQEQAWERLSEQRRSSRRPTTE